MLARVLMAAAAAALLPAAAMAQDTPAPADQPAAVAEQTKPDERGFSIARVGAPAKPAVATPAAKPAKMADGDDMKADAAPGKPMKKAKRHHRRWKRHHAAH